MAEPDESTGGGSILTRKTGPLPNWVWMALLLLLALGYSVWQRNRSANTVEEGPSPEYVPGDQTPPPVFILPQNPQPTVPVNVEVNVPNTPSTPPTAPPAATKPPVTQPTPKPTAPPKPTEPTHFKVTIAKYTSKNPPWNSTLWGIAKNYGLGSAGNNYLSIWNDPRNAALKAKRKDPKKIQPGDVVWIKRR